MRKKNRIDGSKFSLPFTYNDKQKEFRSGATYYSDTISEHGKSRAVTNCGFCGQENDVYKWSFFGGGKRCVNCNALMYVGVTVARADRVVDLDPKKDPRNKK